MKPLEWFTKLRWQGAFAVSVLCGVLYASLVSACPLWLGILLDGAMVFVIGFNIGTLRAERRRLQDLINHTNELKRLTADLLRLGELVSHATDHVSRGSGSAPDGL